MSHLKLFEPDGADIDSPVCLEEPRFLISSLSDMFVADIHTRDEKFARSIRRVMDAFVTYSESELKLNGVTGYRVVRNSSGTKSLWVRRQDGQWSRVTASPPDDPEAA